VTKFVSDLRQVGGFLRVLRGPSTNKTDRNDITEVLLKVALNTINQTNSHVWSSIVYSVLFFFLPLYLFTASDYPFNVFKLVLLIKFHQFVGNEDY
jgi:hypothetical protein